MAGIVFIVQGEGRGHLSQSMALKEMLEARGHRVLAVWAGRNPKHELPAYFEEAFEGMLRYFSSPYFLRTPNKRGIYVGRTIFYNLLRSLSYVRAIRSIRSGIVALKPDLVVNFYDAIGALAMKRLPAGIRKFAVGHHFLLHLEGYPCGGGKRIHQTLLSLHTRIIMNACDRVLALSFREVKSMGRMKVVPPLIRKDFRDLSWKAGKHSLVYLLGEGFISRILERVREDPGFRAHVFSELPEDTPMPDGICLHSFSQKRYLEYLLSCENLVCTAGFESVAEAAYLGIPLGVVPVENHFEQWCNARDVELSRIGTVLDHGSMDQIRPMEHEDWIRYRLWVDRSDEEIVKALNL